MNRIQTELLLRKVQSGDTGALDTLITAYYPQILNYCRWHTADEQQAQDVEYIAAENAVMKAGKIIAQDTTEGLVKQIEAKVWQGNIPMEQLARWEYRLRVVNLRNEPDGTVTLRYLADAPQLPDSVPAQPRLEDLYLWLFPEEMEEAK